MLRCPVRPLRLYPEILSPFTHNGYALLDVSTSTETKLKPNKEFRVGPCGIFRYKMHSPQPPTALRSIPWLTAETKQTLYLGQSKGVGIIKYYLVLLCVFTALSVAQTFN